MESEGNVVEDSSTCVYLVTFLALGVLVLSVLYLIYTKRRLRKAWRRESSGGGSGGGAMLVVHCPGPATHTPCVSSFVMKLRTFLRMAYIPYVLDHTEPMGPRGLCPWVSWEGEVLTDSQLIINRLAATNDAWNLNRQLSETERAVARAFAVMVDEYLCWCLREWRIKADNGRSLAEDGGLSWYQRLLIPAYVLLRRWTLWEQGIGRHTHTQVQQSTRNVLHSLSHFLGDKPFLMGDEATEVDCSVFGQLASIVYNYTRSPYHSIITVEYPNLLQYVERVKARYWPDWDTCLLHS
ncbi:hypothetical protein Pmani_013752 [Petrolisthes manimaculis]|uniref:Uncharacterized protein n=1 Tax=Petrolisthes manimaculis TaxID=1843537 RepID=A0AAE1PXQ2_9EUCA|nr:hypothetical protein Pmani_013752 [Petrolisthes manimaculis]